MSLDIYLSLSLECIQNTSGREPPCAPASSIVQYSSHLTTEILTLMPVFAVKSSIICFRPGSWLLSQILTDSSTSPEDALSLLPSSAASPLSVLSLPLSSLAVSPLPPHAASENTIVPASANANTFLNFICCSSFKRIFRQINIFSRISD